MAGAFLLESFLVRKSGDQFPFTKGLEVWMPREQQQRTSSKIPSLATLAWGF
jgi:hypothetical protein